MVILGFRLLDEWAFHLKFLSLSLSTGSGASLWFERHLGLVVVACRSHATLRFLVVVVSWRLSRVSLPLLLELLSQLPKFSGYFDCDFRVSEAPSILTMLNRRLPRLGASIAKHLFPRNNSTSISRAGYIQSAISHHLQPPLQKLSFTKLYNGAMIINHNFLSTTSASNTSEEGSEQKETISVTFVDKDGEEKHIKVPVGMSMLEAAHENDIELEGACEGSLACSTCHVIIMDVEHYNKLEDPTDEENDMLDLAFGLTETSRLGCQVIARPELDGIRLAIPAATRNFAVDGYVPKPH